MSSWEEFDHIVVGAGASGCVAAARLVSGGDRRVLLLEAGHSHRNLLLDLPPGISKLKWSKYMKHHFSVPQDHLGGRVLDIPQGNALGGGTAVNAQVYIRGRPSDYDEWDAVLGRDPDGVRWNWTTVLKHFIRMESNHRLSGELHGTAGPLLVSDPGHINDLSRWFVQSVQDRGEPFCSDFNGESQRGAGFYQFTNRDGQRSSAAHAFVDPLAGDDRLTVRVQAQVTDIIIENGRAVGVRYRDKSGPEHVVYSCGDILLSAGSLVTPKILMLSGIGKAALLDMHGITTIADLPGVGQNLIDHPKVPVVATCNGPHGYFRQSSSWQMLKHGLNFKLFGNGPILTVGFEAGAFVNPLDRDEAPSIQAFCSPVLYREGLEDACADTYGVTLTTGLLKPKSRGSVELRSADPLAPPLVSPQYLSEPDDMRIMIAGQRFFRDVLLSGPLGQRVEKIIAPAGSDLSDVALAEHCRMFVKTDYHPCGTARMGAANDSMAVLDAQLRVRGVDNLRVCDLSAMPNIVAGNTAAPAMMLGDRCADFILGLDRST